MTKNLRCGHLVFEAISARFFQVCEAGARIRQVIRYFAGGLLSAIFVFFADTPQAGAFTVEREGNHLSISGAIGIESPSVFNRNVVEVLLELALRGDSDSAVHLHLNLPRGGVAAPAFELVELMRSAQHHGTRFVAQVGPNATCMSGCTFLFLAADERYIAPEGRLIFHGFSQADPENPVEVPQKFHDAYYRLLKSANEPFYRFFRHARIIEDDKKVGFTGKTLLERKVFTGLISGFKFR